MAYNNGFPINYQQIQPVQQVGFVQPNQISNIQNVNQAQIQSAQPVFNQITDDRIMVNGLDNVKLYPIAPGRTETIWDIDGKTFYRVTAGATPRIFNYDEVTSPVIQQNINQNQIENNVASDTSEYVKISDLEEILNKIVDEKLNENKEIIKPQIKETVDQNKKATKRQMARTNVEDK